MITPSSSNTSILVLGSSDTGKTHFITQLFGRLRAGTGKLKLRTAPDNFGPFEAALTRLNQGLAADHTATAAFHELRLPMATADGKHFDFVLPDYGGEQVRAMIDDRRITEEWEQRTQKSNGWLLFLRLGRLNEDRNIVSRPLELMLESHPQQRPCTPREWSDQTRIIEFLQLLLYARGASLSNRLSKPILGVILSCWDELDTVSKNQTPEDILRAKLPLLADFIEANWLREAGFVLGVSSLERPLDPKKADEEFINQGPEQFGYIIEANGNESRDLTRPLVEVLARM